MKSKSNTRNIKIFGEHVPRGIEMEEQNNWIINGNARFSIFPLATSKQLLHYLDVNLNCIIIDTILHVGINNILNDTSTSSI